MTTESELQTASQAETLQSGPEKTLVLDSAPNSSAELESDSWECVSVTVETEATAKPALESAAITEQESAVVAVPGSARVTADTNRLKPVERENVFFTGKTYSCPWEFKLPNPVSYSFFVAKTVSSRVEPSNEELKQFRESDCNFPLFKSKTVWITWLGHASCLFTFFGDCGTLGKSDDEMMKEKHSKTIRVLCDPNFSNFIGPVRGVGSKRHIPSACQVEELPKIHALCISHNHMDHMDARTLKQLALKMPNIQCFVPMGDSYTMNTFGFKNVHEMTWWESRNHLFEDLGLSITFTPASHWSGRGLNDKNSSLWGSFVLESCSHKVFFAGDTGYQAEIFKAIGKKYGPFSLAAIPIGCYEPREVFSVQHVCPKDAVIIHREICSQLSVGIHWGAFRMTTLEGVLQPPEDLERAMAEARKSSGGSCVPDFVHVKVGGSRCYPPVSPQVAVVGAVGCGADTVTSSL